MAEPQPNSTLPPDRATGDESAPGALPVMDYAPPAREQCPMYRRVMCWVLGIAGVGILTLTTVQGVIAKQPDPGRVDDLLVGVGLVVMAFVIRFQHVPIHLFGRRRD